MENILIFILGACGCIFGGYMVAKLWEQHDKLNK